MDESISKAKCNLFIVVSFWFAPILAVLIGYFDIPLGKQITLTLSMLFTVNVVLGKTLKSISKSEHSINRLSWLANNANILNLIKETLRYFVRVGFWYGVVIVFTVAALLLFFMDKIKASEHIINFANNGWIYPVFIGWVITVMSMMVKLCNKSSKC